MARRTRDDDDEDDDDIDDDDQGDDDDEDDFENDPDPEPQYASLQDWLDAYEDGLFDDLDYEEADGGVGYGDEE